MTTANGPPTPNYQKGRALSFKGYLCFLVGLELLYEMTIFGALLKSDKAGAYYPSFFLVASVSEMLNAPYIFYAAYFFVFPVGGLALFFTGIVLIYKSDGKIYEPDVKTADK